MADCGIAQKELAIDLGLSPEKFCRQLAGREPLNALRLWGLTSAQFRKALTKRLCDRMGVSVVTDERVNAMLERVEVLVGLKPMAKSPYTQTYIIPERRQA